MIAAEIRVVHLQAMQLHDLLANHQKLMRGREKFSLKEFKKSMTLLSLMSDFWPLEL